MVKSNAEATYDRVSKLSEAALADLILKDMQQLTERASVRGVTAYREKPVQRVRLNERFLQSTLRNTGTANKRVQEQQMWAARRSQLKMEQEQGRAPAKRSLSTREDSHRWLTRDEVPNNKRIRITAQRKNSSESSHSDERSSSIERMDRTSSGSLDRGGEELGAQPGPSAEEAAEAELDALLSKRRVRGRGAVGSRADEPGPYLPVPDTGYVFGSSDDSTIQPRVVAGPPVPTWLRRELEVLPQPSFRSSPLVKASRLVGGPGLEVQDLVEATDRKKKREKKGKKEKSDKKKVSKRKEKQKHRQKRARDDG